MNKINLVILIGSSNLGGTERSAIILYKYLDKSVFNVKFCMTIKPDARFITRLEGIAHEFIELDKLNEYIKKNKIDVLFSYIAHDEVSLKKLNNITKMLRPIVFTNQYSPLVDANLFITKTELLKAKIYNGGYLKNDYVLYFPIDVVKWESLSKKVKSFNESDKRITLGRIGRTEPSKWHYLILSTLHYFKRNDGFKKYNFVFAGMPKLYEWYVKLFFNKYIKNKAIILLPELVDDEAIAKVYKSIDVFIQSSWIGESFGCVIAEAFCFDCAVIADWKRFTKDGKSASFNKYDSQLELVDLNKSGFYANYPLLIYDWIEKQDKYSLKKLGNYGHKKTKELYSAKVVAKNLEYLIKGKILYDNKIVFNKVNPSKKEINSFFKHYQENFKKIDLLNLPFFYKLKYDLKAIFWRSLEYIYLFIRKLLLKLFNYNIEKR